MKSEYNNSAFSCEQFQAAQHDKTLFWGNRHNAAKNWKLWRTNHLFVNCFRLISMGWRKKSHPKYICTSISHVAAMASATRICSIWQTIAVPNGNFQFARRCMASDDSCKRIRKVHKKPLIMAANKNDPCSVQIGEFWLNRIKLDFFWSSAKKTHSQFKASHLQFACVRRNYNFNNIWIFFCVWMLFSAVHAMHTIFTCDWIYFNKNYFAHSMYQISLVFVAHTWNLSCCNDPIGKYSLCQAKLLFKQKVREKSGKQITLTDCIGRWKTCIFRILIITFFEQ